MSKRTDDLRASYAAFLSGDVETYRAMCAADLHTTAPDIGEWKTYDEMVQGVGAAMEKTPTEMTLAAVAEDPDANTVMVLVEFTAAGESGREVHIHRFKNDKVVEFTVVPCDPEQNKRLYS
jgi:ketosteroid isomerase-like protein